MGIKGGVLSKIAPPLVVLFKGMSEAYPDPGPYPSPYTYPYSYLYCVLVKPLKKQLEPSRLDENTQHIVNNLYKTGKLSINGVTTFINPKVLSVSVGSLLADAHCCSACPLNTIVFSGLAETRFWC